jgi:hypothetical protein
LPYADAECQSLDECRRRDGGAAVIMEAGACESAIEQALAAIGQAKALGVSTLPVEIDQAMEA